MCVWDWNAYLGRILNIYQLVLLLRSLLRLNNINSETSMLRPGE